MHQVSKSTRLGYEVLWIARMLTRREDVLFGAEMRLERRMLEEYERATAGASHEPREIPSVSAENFSVEEFRELYKDRSPLVIRGLGKHIKAAREWNADFFVEKYGDTLVDVRDSPQERVGTTAVFNQADYVPTPLRDYVHEMRHGTSERYFGAMAELFKQHPELMDDLEIDELDARAGVKVIRPEIFMGTPRNHTPWHCAGIDNYFLQINGRKHWHFIDPVFTAGMYLKSSAMVFGAPGLFSNVIPGDDRLFPLFAKTPQLQVTLEPGDFLYNPAYFWHEVENIGETMGCALRCVGEKSFDKFVVLDKFLLATSLLNPRILVSNIQMTLNHFLASRRRERLFIDDLGPRVTVPIKGRRGPTYVEARRARLGLAPLPAVEEPVERVA